MFGDSDNGEGRLWTFAALAALLIVGLVVGAAYIGTSTEKRFSQISEGWDDHNSDAELKGSLLNKIRADLGYGGFIHAFKNYVLRQDPRLLGVVKEKLSSVKATLLKYEQLHLADDEHQAIAAIQETIKQYEQKLPIAAEAASQGLIPLEVDKLVKVEDRLAFEAMEVLTLKWEESHDTVTEALQHGISRAEKIIKSGILMVMLFALAAAILLWFLRLFMRELLTIQKSLKQEIKEHEQAEGALRESEERFRALSYYTPNKLHIKDIEGRYVLINRKSEELFGVTNEEAQGKKAADIFSSDMGEAFEAHNRAVIETGEPIETEEEFLIEGDVHTYLTVKFPILGADGDIVAVGSSGHEITARKQAEDELIQHRDHLEEIVSERIAEVKEKAVQLEDALAREKEYNALQQKFTSLVGHELRTPLAIIDGAAQRLIRRKDKLDADELESKANRVRSAVRRMIGLIDTTLYVAHLDSGELELNLSPCNIRELIMEVCERQAEVSTSHNIQVEVEDLPSEIIADPARIDQVFTNLLSNAVKYAPESPLIKVRGWVDAGNAVVSVTDNGVGIPKDELPSMFKRFFRAKTAEGIKGTGIGLSVVKEYVEMHGGTIGVDSVEGEGAAFTARLPIDAKSRSVEEQPIGD